MRDPMVVGVPAAYSDSTATTDDGGSGGDGAAAPVVRGDGGDVGEMRRSEARSRVAVAAVGDDGDEWNELGGAPGALQLRRRVVMLKAATPAIPGRREDVKEVREEVAVRVMMLGGQRELTGVGRGGEPRRRRRDAFGKGVGGGWFRG